MKNIIAVSSCFLVDARHNGKNKISNETTLFLEFLRDNGVVILPVCPEQMGGLTTPRVSSEIINGRVINKEGTDNTDSFMKGARDILHIMKFQNAEVAFLKQKSPSCGNGKVYDGTFTKKLISGKGKTTQVLEESGIFVYTEEDLVDLSFISKHFGIDITPLKEKLMEGK
jgi:uncharacterized protein YbbK (DUF523 family)